MEKICYFILILFASPLAAQIEPVNAYEELFFDIQMEEVFDDSKTFNDCEPKAPPVRIVADYQLRASGNSFDLKNFVSSWFSLPDRGQSGHGADQRPTVEEHIHQLWDALTRESSGQETWTSLIALPFPYVVPGGRFREIYYWDSYFTMLGLAESGRTELVRSMLNNFSFLIDQYGFIPNGNRTYYLSRSQPPFFAMMIELLGKMEGEEAMAPYREALEKEYRFWMNGESRLSDSSRRINHVVLLDRDIILNRYWDYEAEPRPESFREDYRLAQTSPGNDMHLYLNLRSAAESGWDFSSRWLADHQSLASIRTIELLPVDLNCLLFQAEKTLSKLFYMSGDSAAGKMYDILAKQREKAIVEIFWNEEEGFFSDYDLSEQQPSGQLTMAAAFPLFFSLADQRQAKLTVKNLLSQLEAGGGFLTTTIASGQQWDKPNGWAPLQFIGIHGLLNYGYRRDAMRIAEKWLSLNERVYRETGKMMEKYNVVDMDLKAGGGEYPNQDGFGWTNGVYLALKRVIGKTK